MDLKKIIKKAGYTSIVTSTILAVIGVIMFLYSETTMKIIAYILGGLLILTGIVKIIEYITQKGEYDLFNYDLIYGILSIVLGIVIIRNTGTLQGLLGIIVGVWIIYNSLTRFDLSIKLKAYKVSTWWIMIVIAVLMMLCGIYIIFVPDIIIASLGGILFIYSIMDIIESIAFISNIKKIED